jgi:hypothetical protein
MRLVSIYYISASCLYNKTIKTSRLVFKSTSRYKLAIEYSYKEEFYLLRSSNSYLIR